jgi:hypothetical protein
MDVLFDEDFEGSFIQSLIPVKQVIVMALNLLKLLQSVMFQLM